MRSVAHGCPTLCTVLGYAVRSHKLPRKSGSRKVLIISRLLHQSVGSKTKARRPTSFVLHSQSVVRRQIKYLNLLPAIVNKIWQPSGSKSFTLFRRALLCCRSALRSIMIFSLACAGQRTPTNPYKHTSPVRDRSSCLRQISFVFSNGLLNGISLYSFRLGSPVIQLSHSH